jgi:hypothetical protein
MPPWLFPANPIPIGVFADNLREQISASKTATSLPLGDYGAAKAIDGSGGEAEGWQ